MSRDAQRQVRLRLARQRTGPARVRARVRQEPPEPTPEPAPEPEQALSRWRRTWARLGTVRWTQHITVIGMAAGALAAIAGLWFQAVATYWSQQTAKDQLNQSKEDSDRTKREQASRIGFWAVNPRDDNASGSLHVVNRSPDPVTDVSVLVAASPGPRVELWNLMIDTMQPCSEYVYSFEKLKLTPQHEVGDEVHEYSISTDGATVHRLYFRDQDGEPWVRTEEGLRVLRKAALRAEPEAIGVVSVGSQRVKALANCSTGTK